MSPERWVVLALLLALLLACWGWYRARYRVRRGNARRMSRAMAGEDGADALLRAHGYRVLDHQVTVEFPILLDGEEVWVSNRCDRMVERDGQVFVAEVKTGPRASDPKQPATRRQLLEYLLVHEVDGVLLVDMDNERIIEVGFPTLVGT